ncbi:hypothetical protein ACFLQ0_04490 [Nitrospinota bacterium]
MGGQSYPSVHLRLLSEKLTDKTRKVMTNAINCMHCSMKFKDHEFVDMVCLVTTKLKYVGQNWKKLPFHQRSMIQGYQWMGLESDHFCTSCVRKTFKNSTLEKNSPSSTESQNSIKNDGVEFKFINPAKPKWGKDFELVHLSFPKRIEEYREDFEKFIYEKLTQKGKPFQLLSSIALPRQFYEKCMASDMGPFN